MSDDLEKMWEEDSTPEIKGELKNESLKEVSFWATEQLRLTAEVTVAEESLADLKKELKDISEQKLPDAMRECNLSEIRLADGVKVSVQQFYRGEDDSADGILQSLTAQGYSPSNKRWVEPMTLKAFAREQVENGTDLPFETFNVYVGQKTKITKG